MIHSEFLKSIEKKLLGLKTKKAKDKNFIRLSIPVPQVRKFTHKLAPQELTTDQNLRLWDYVWKNTKYFEVMSLAIYHFQYRSLNQKEITKLFTWLNRCHCWEHSDDLSKIFAQALEEKPSWVLPKLTEWNSSKNSWKRRQSLVSLIEYHGKRKKVLPYSKLIKFIKHLIKDEEYYVQKGLGWTLREIYCVYPDQTFTFIEKHLKELSPIAYSTSTEKLDKKTKANLNARRKALRAK